MRSSPLREKLAAAGAVFRERHGVEVAAHFGNPRAECGAVRDAAALADFSFARVFTLPETPGIDYLDALLAGNVPKIRFGRVLHTFLADNNGLLAADCFVANNDQEFVFICESIVPDAQLNALLSLEGKESPAKDLTADHVVLSLDGFRAWEIVKKIFGPDIIGLPYLSIENYQFLGEPVRFIRAGKTSEFGYLLVAPVKIAAELFDALKAGVDERSGRLAGADAHDALRLEGRFFNIFREGEIVRDPLPLGLQRLRGHQGTPRRRLEAKNHRFRGGRGLRRAAERRADFPRRQGRGRGRDRLRFACAEPAAGAGIAAVGIGVFRPAIPRRRARRRGGAFDIHAADRAEEPDGEARRDVNQAGAC